MSSASSGVEEFFDRQYRRFGRWYLAVLMLCTWALVVLFTMPTENITQVPLWTGRGFSEWRYIGAFMVIAAVSGPLALPTVVLTRHRALFQMQRGEAVNPVEAWRAAVTKAPRTALLVTLLWSLFINFLGIAWVARHEHFGAETYVAAVIPQFMLAMGSGATFFMVYEMAWLPFARKIAPALPDDFVPETGLTVRRRLMLITTATTFSIGCSAAGLAMGFDDRESRIWAVVLGTVALVGTFIGLLLALVSFSVTRRVNELARSIGSIGRERVHVYPSTGDEFDEVGRALNRTVGRLDEHARGLQESRARLVGVADETRRRAERDLHDGAQQHLALVSMKLALLERRAAARPDTADAVARMRGQLGDALEELRSLAHGIYPVSLEHDGLIGALDVAARQARVRVDVEAPENLSRWPREIETALYFCCWELIQGVARHPAVNAAVRVSLGERRRTGTFAIEAPLVFLSDDNPTLLFLRDRIGAVGGEVTVTPTDEGIRAAGGVRVR